MRNAVRVVGDDGFALRDGRADGESDARERECTSDDREHGKPPPGATANVQVVTDVWTAAAGYLSWPAVAAVGQAICGRR